MDYLIGEEKFLRRHIRKRMVCKLLDIISEHKDEKRVIVQPEPENAVHAGHC